MQWIETFILGVIAGWVGAMIFIPKIGRHLAKKRDEERQMVVAEVAEVRDGNGNLIEKDDPRYQEAMALLRKQIPFPVGERPENTDKKAD